MSTLAKSPFRYPGGKSWFVPKIRYWLQNLNHKPVSYYEPFAGGSNVGLAVALEDLSDHVTLIELDEDLAAVWNTIIYGDYKWLANKISGFELNENSLEDWLQKTKLNEKENAFRTILKNRVNRSGLLISSAGKLRYGENGKGIQSRWYPKTISDRIRNIGSMREKLTFINGDGMEFISETCNEKNAVFFIDPPYTAGGAKPGTRLYTHSELDHDRLFQLANMICGDFVMTYDDNEVVRELVKNNNFDMELIPMKSSHHIVKNELVIGKNLEWLRINNTAF